MIPVIFSSSVIIIVTVCSRNGTESETFGKFLLIVVRMFMSIQLVNLSLKLDDIVAWEWNETFWAYWIFFSIMSGLSMAIT